jgi:hypothetical protein
LEEVGGESISGIADAVPQIGAELALKTRLQAIPRPERALEEGFARCGEREDPLATVVAAMTFDPSLLQHRFQGAGERCTVDGEYVGELFLVGGADE